MIAIIIVQHLQTGCVVNSAAGVVAKLDTTLALVK